ncbi:hypothetical protein LJR231_003499 [Phyllobacterium sp. LjRoot231]|uniref:hypothetical protein n=1 Tax=Phyllobacterium sp. LjRoot231 TaxID=3342289 RepID=UPI003ED10F58
MSAEISAKVGNVWLKLENGFTVSLQMGRAYYGSNYDYTDDPSKLPPANTVEVGILDKNGSLVTIGEDSVLAYVPVMQAIDLILLVKLFPADVTSKQIEAIVKSARLIHEDAR